MKDIMEDFGTLYHAKSALVFYETEGSKTGCYVEYFDMDRNGNPINAHPLNLRESSRLAKMLRTAKEKQEPFLKPDGIMAGNILYLDAVGGRAIWHTKTARREMYFTEKLGLPNGTASVPAMLWAADRNSLRVYALDKSRKPTMKTILYNAPFFNVYEDGRVCMGTVDVRIRRTASLEEFTEAWEGYFFNSYFSHLMQDYNPIKGNCVSLWERLMAKGGDFPAKVLKKSEVQLNDLIK